MNAWLDANAEGLALLLWFGLAGIAFLLVAAAIEWAQAAPMRKRRRRLEAYRRYLTMVDPQ